MKRQEASFLTRERSPDVSILPFAEVIRFARVNNCPIQVFSECLRSAKRDISHVNSRCSMFRHGGKLFRISRRFGWVDRK